MIRAFFIAVAVSTTLPVHAQQQSVKPGINRRFENPNVSEKPSVDSAQRRTDFQSYYAKRPFLGVGCQPLGVCKVTDVVDGSPLQLSGLKVGDVIVRFNDTEVEDFARLQELVAKGTAGQPVKLTIHRDERPLVLTTKLTNWDSARRLLIRGPPSLRGSYMGSAEFNFSGVTKVEAPEFTQQENAILTAVFELPHPTWLYIQGNLKLDGTLRVELVRLEPSLGDTFEIITVDGRLVGRFKNLELPKLPRGLVWRIVYDDIESGTDFDGDGEIDITLVVAKQGVAKQGIAHCRRTPVPRKTRCPVRRNR